MKTYEVQVRIEGTIDVEDPNCPSGWRGSGCYMTACKCWQDVTVTLTAESEDEARNKVKAHDFEEPCCDVEDIEEAVRLHNKSPYYKKKVLENMELIRRAEEMRRKIINFGE